MTPALATLLALTIGSAHLLAPGGQLARLGDVATALADSDVADVVALAACGRGSPWLLTAFKGMMTDVQVVDVFCAADEVNGALRRGQMSWVKRERFQSGTWSRWELQEQHRYAQLVPADRTFEQITGEQDLNRPLWLRGDFTDDELIALVKFLRSRPTWTGGTAREQIEGEWPVTVVWREADGTVVASLNKNYLEGQRVTLRQSANEWTIVKVSFWIA